MKLIYILFLIFLIKQCRSQISCENFQAGSVDDVSPECMDQLMMMCHNGSLWWRMVDASSKYPFTGMEYSNNRDLGNYDECIDIFYQENDSTIKGKYCGLSVAIVNIFDFIHVVPNPYKLEIKPRALAHLPKANFTHNLDVRELRDITDEISISTLSLCIPDKCTPKEVGMFFIWGQLSELETPIVNFVDALPCMTKDSNTDFRGGDIAFITVLALILFFSVASTTYDFIIQKLEKKPHHPLLLAFSFLTNGKKLLHTSAANNPNQIQCLNGIRFVSMMWVIAGHNYVAMEQVPLINYTEVKGFIDRVLSMYIGSGPIAVDTFFFLSGFLLTYGYLKSAVKLPPIKQVMNVPMMIVHRYLRLTPAVAMLFFTSITIFRLTGTGPMWDYVSQALSRQCTDHWWAFFLYIQNYVNYSDMCLNHTWYLSADMQMFILAPIALIPIAELLKRKKDNLVIYGLLVTIAIFVIFPMGIRFADQTIDNVYDTHSRLNNYLTGILLGVIIRDARFQKFPFSKLTNLAIWCFVLNICVAFNIYYHSIVRIYEHTSDTLFYGLYRPIWCFSLAWMVYSCHKGYGGPINWFLSLPIFQIGARLSYCMYLLHAVVEMYFVGLVRTWYYWGDYMIFYLWCGHFVVTMLMSAIWSLAFESPMIVIEKFIFGGAGKRPQK